MPMTTNTVDDIYIYNVMKASKYIQRNKIDSLHRTTATGSVKSAVWTATVPTQPEPLIIRYSLLLPVHNY